MRYAAITERLQGLGADKWLVHLRAKEMRRRGEDVIMLSIGEPDIPTSSDLMDILEASMRAGRTAYSSGRGEHSLLDALSRKYSARTGRSVTPENFVCLPGTQTALFAVMTALANPGDGVLTGDPLYATYDSVIRSTGAHRISVPLDPANGFRMRAADLEKAITPESRVLLLNTPHNPTGAVLSREDIHAIGEVCEKHDLWIIADEVYEELVFDGGFASPFDDAKLAERTVVVSSISKSHAAPGFRSGWCAGPVEFCEKLLPLAEAMLFGSQPFIADMTADALSRPAEAAAAMRTSFKRRADLIRTAFGNSDIVQCHKPEAGMFLLADIRKTGLSGEAFAIRLLEEEKVAVMPGESFGEQINGFIRISLTVADETIIDACKRIKRFAERSGA
jgi:arginine:pyruvate transaminase